MPVINHMINEHERLILRKRLESGESQNQATERFHAAAIPP
jgi:hypothetical protein